MSLFLTAVFLLGFSYPDRQYTPQIQDRQVDADSVIWVNAVRFATLFNNADTAAMENFLPENFMLQLLHQNFLGKKGLLNIMKDTAVQKTFQHLLHRDANTVIQYADNHQSACLNVAIDFINSSVLESVKKEHGYGLSILYFQLVNGRWTLETVHLDLHCSLCNE